MKKSISINLQGLVFHIEEDGYEHLRRYLQEVKAHFATYAGHEEIVADIESRIAELFAARLTTGKQVITADEVATVTAQLGRVTDFELPDDDDATAAGAGAAHHANGAAGSSTGYPPPPQAEPTGPRQLFRDESNKKVAGVAAGLAHYFNTSALWFRLGFVGLVLLNSTYRGLTPWDDDFSLAGLSIVSYLVLWLVMPKRTGLPSADGTAAFGGGTGRKLFRDTDAGSLGGVSAGLAHYLRLDVTLVRVLFIVLSVVGGSGVLLYLVLWAVVPEARTVTEKLEMRGEDVTLSNITSNLNTDPIGAGRARVVQDNLSSIGLRIAPIFQLAFTLIAGFVGIVFLVLALVLLIAIGAVLGVVLGVLPATGVTGVQTGDIPLELLRTTLPAWGLVAGFVVFLIPAFSLLMLALRLFIKRPLLSASVRLSLFGLWLLAVIGLTASTMRLYGEFREHDEVRTTQTLPTAAPIIVLEAPYDENSDHMLRIRTVRVVKADSGQPLTATVRIKSYGTSAAAARQAAEVVEYQLALRDDSVLTLPRAFRFKPGAAWRMQQVYVTLNLPADRRYRLSEEGFTDLLDNDVYDDRYSRDHQNDKRLWTVNNGRFRLAAGPETTEPREEDDADDDDDDEIRIKNGDGDVVWRFRDPRGFGLMRPRPDAPTRAYEVSKFDRVEISGAYQARIRRGTTFRVTAKGDQKLFDQVEVRVSGTTLEIDSKTSLGWRNRQNGDLLFEIELPELSGAELSGAARADIDGFGGGAEKLVIEQSGASVVRLKSQGRPLDLDANGGSRTLLEGTAPNAYLQLSGAAQLNGRRLRATNAEVSTSGAARASITVKRDLQADANGASHITYYGQPTDASTNSSGAGIITNGDRSGNNQDNDDDDDSADQENARRPATDDTHNANDQALTFSPVPLLPAPLALR